MPPHAVRWLKEQAYFLVVLVVLASGFGYLAVSGGHWRRSTFVMGGAMVLAAALRAFVPPGRVGLLAVRAKWLDTTAYFVLGVVVLAADIRLHR
jgi:hypothetical protein